MNDNKEYAESCEDCIHYTEKSYCFGECEVCRHEVSCNAVCTMFAERLVTDESVDDSRC